MPRPRSLSLLALEARISLLIDAQLETLRLSGGAVDPKSVARAAHRPQRDDRLLDHRAFALSAWGQLSSHFADGSDVDPWRIRPRLELVSAGTWQAQLFRLATLTWSVPVSRGYGRRMRFLVWDDHNGKLIGLIGLTDPVFNLGARDAYVGWSVRERRRHLVNVMDAFVLGAVPPYSMLLGGKLVASLLKTKEVRDTFSSRYHDRSGRISKRRKFPRLVMVTTTSALGRSSVYNRLRIGTTTFLTSVGYTLGWGHFHFSDELIILMRSYLRRRRHPYASGHQYGDGPNWRLRVIRATLVKLGRSPDALKHGIQREVFVCELATNARALLRGTARRPRYTGLLSVQQVSEAALRRWMIPRAQRNPAYRNWSKDALLPLVVSPADAPPEGNDLAAS